MKTNLQNRHLRFELLLSLLTPLPLPPPIHAFLFRERGQEGELPLPRFVIELRCSHLDGTKEGNNWQSNPPLHSLPILLNRGNGGINSDRKKKNVERGGRGRGRGDFGGSSKRRERINPSLRFAKGVLFDTRDTTQHELCSSVVSRDETILSGRVETEREDSDRGKWSRGGGGGGGHYCVQYMHVPCMRVTAFRPPLHLSRSFAGEN